MKEAKLVISNGRPKFWGHGPLSLQTPLDLKTPAEDPHAI